MAVERFTPPIVADIGGVRIARRCQRRDRSQAAGAHFDAYQADVCGSDGWLG